MRATQVGPLAACAERSARPSPMKRSILCCREPVFASLLAGGSHKQQAVSGRSRALLPQSIGFPALRVLTEGRCPSGAGAASGGSGRCSAALWH